MTVPPTADGVGLTPAGMVMTGLTGIAPTGGAGTALGWTSIAPALAPTITVPLELASCGEKKVCKLQVRLKDDKLFLHCSVNYLWVLNHLYQIIHNWTKYNDLKLPQFWSKKMKREKRRKKTMKMYQDLSWLLKALLVNWCVWPSQSLFWRVGIMFVWQRTQT